MVKQTDVILKIENYLKDNLPANQLWGEKNFTYRMIEKRKNGEPFRIEEHIRGMIYSILSGGNCWNTISKNNALQPETGQLLNVDETFWDYDVDKILNCSIDELAKKLEACGLKRYKKASLVAKALRDINIPKLKAWEEKYGTIDDFYGTYINKDHEKGAATPGISLIRALAESNSDYKLEQMYVPLVCEYLRNVGYDFPKPDTHLRRILGCEILGFSPKKAASYYEAIEIVFKLAEMTGKSVAETDYILWIYCANKYGEICTAKNPKCNKCVVMKQCKKQQE